jgi:hypothetical protein
MVRPQEVEQHGIVQLVSQIVAQNTHRANMGYEAKAVQLPERQRTNLFASATGSGAAVGVRHSKDRCT